MIDQSLPALQGHASVSMPDLRLLHPIGVECRGTQLQGTIMTTLEFRAIGIALAAFAAVAAPLQTSAQLVNNGGFETGNLTGWTGTGDTAFNGAQCAGPGASVYEGSCSAFFGPFLAIGGIEQVINVGSAGLPWDLSFAFMADGADPSSFTVTFGGVTLLSLANPPAGAYGEYRFSGTTTAADMTLSFDFFNPAGFLSLDAVLVAVPEVGTLGLLGAGLAALFFYRRRKTT